LWQTLLKSIKKEIPSAGTKAAIPLKHQKGITSLVPIDNPGPASPGI
jgi:hypothetical protein